ncbi:MAG: O-antigen ligase family protein [Rhodospirillales bacterium]|nr:O-antigen ligase family protein [Rhodospirillales bacterium]
MRSEQPVIYWTLILVVVLAPLPYASIHPWSWSFLACAIGALVAAWSVRVLVGVQKPAFGLRATWPFIALLAVFAGWAALQTVTWTPAAWHHPLWESAARALDLDLGGRVSLSPDETFAALTRLLTYAGIFWLALQYGRRTARAEQIFLAIIIAGAAYGLWGLLQLWFGWESRLGLPGPDDGWFAWGTVADSHPYATYVSMALICASALVLARGAATPRRSLGDLIRRLADGSGASWPLLGVWLLLLAMISIFRSPGDMTGAGVALVALFAVASVGKLARPLRLAVFAVGSVLTIAVVATIQEIVAPIAPLATSDAHELDQLQSLSLDAIAGAPLLGTGYGTFEDIFRFYRTSDFPATVLHARSGYLETILELGLPAAIAAFLLVAGLLLLTLSGAVRRQRDSAYAAAGFAATVLIGYHAAYDYSLQVPAVIATYSLLIGTACAQARSSRREDDDW